MSNLLKNMYCPNCGAKNNNEQKFCRFCGLNIETTIKSLKTQLSNGVQENRFELLKWVKRIVSFGLMVSSSLGVTILIGNFFEWWQIDRVVSRITLFSYLGFLFINFLITRFQNKKNQTNLSSNLETNKLGANIVENQRSIVDQQFEPIQSIVEDSTEFLALENKTRKLK